MIDLLRETIVNVTFTKVNGEKRIMLCTLREDIIPKVAGKSKPQDGIITVYDLENSGWRSIKENSIISFEEIPLEE